jgi:hypothetical protein
MSLPNVAPGKGDLQHSFARIFMIYSLTGYPEEPD